MGPNIWGPYGWKFIHFVALAYPNKPSNIDKENYKIFFESLSHVIPCSLCADNYKDHLRIYPLTDEILDNKQNLVKWSVDMHNLVNKENEKEVYSYDKAITEISNSYDKESEQCKKNYELLERVKRDYIKDTSTMQSIDVNLAKQDPNDSMSSHTYIINFIILFFTVILILQVTKLYLKAMNQQS